MMTKPASNSWGILTRRTLGSAALAAALLLVAGACGDSEDSAAGGTSVDSSETRPESTLPGTTEPTDAPTATTTTTATTTSTTEPAVETTLPGEEFAGFASAGDTLAVMGVAHDDVLNVRAAPGTDQVIVSTVSPAALDVVATGRARQLPNSIWYEVEANGSTGWASASFLGFVGGTDDVTAEHVGAGTLPEAEGMVELGFGVAESFASDDPESLVVQSTPADVGDLGEVTYDVIGIGDDAVAGYRLHVFATPDEGASTFVLKSIERTTFCARGLAGDLCV